jgi:hypothetical protein
MAVATKASINDRAFAKRSSLKLSNFAGLAGLQFQSVAAPSTRYGCRRVLRSGHRASASVPATASLVFETSPQCPALAFPR